MQDKKFTLRAFLPTIFSISFTRKSLATRQGNQDWMALGLSLTENELFARILLILGIVKSTFPAQIHQKYQKEFM